MKYLVDQWNRIENSEINACIYSQLTFDKGSKPYFGEWTVSNKWCWKTGYPFAKE
jgi:hypothetical protein